MSLRKNQAGFSIVEGLLLLIIVAALAGVGYFVYNQQQDKQAGVNQTSYVAKEDQVPEAPQVETAADLDNADKTIDQVNLDEDSENSELDRELNSF